MLKHILPVGTAAPAKRDNDDGGLQQIVGAMPDLVLVFDYQGHCHTVVPTRSAESSLRAEMFAPETYFERGNDLLDALRRAARDERPVEIECRKAGAPGTWYSAVLSPLDGSGQVLFVGRDVTGRKETETSLLRSKDELVKRLAETMAEIGQANDRMTAQIRELEQRNRAISLLGDMASLLQSCIAPGEAYGVVARFMPQLLPGSSGQLAIIRDSRNLAEIESVWGDAERGSPVFPPSDCWALRNGRVHDSADMPACSHVARVQPGSLCAPMLAQGEALGVMHVGAPAAFSESQRNLLLAASEQIALALAGLRLRLALNDMSIRDALTGLFNRRYLEESLDRELLRARREGSSVGVIMFDVDHFKKFNDTYGHETGDDLLRELGAMVKTVIRGHDIACRYGGEEFTLILPGADLSAAQRRAEELRIKVRSNLRLKVAGPEGATMVSVTLSLGVAVYPGHGADKAALLKAADMALYQAKKGGRNVVMTAETVGSGQ